MSFEFEGKPLWEKPKERCFLQNEDVEIGAHCWALMAEKLLIVLKTNTESFEVCGAWGCGVDSDRLQIISVINAPKGFEKTRLYYLF
jgi:hypothetical protein